MLHSEYHTCDKCGKTLDSWSDGYKNLIVEYPHSMTKPELDSAYASVINQSEEHANGSVYV